MKCRYSIVTSGNLILNVGYNMIRTWKVKTEVATMEFSIDDNPESDIPTGSKRITIGT